MNIIFLDVDGVLNSEAYFEENKNKGYLAISDYHLQMLAKIYHTCNANIVLSSSWRILDDKDVKSEIYQCLLDELARYDMKIVSKTSVIGMNRPLEIKTWLDSYNRWNQDTIHFVSLDDDFSKEDYDKYGIGDCLIKTCFYCNKVSEGGLQPGHVAKAIEILNGEE